MVQWEETDCREQSGGAEGGGEGKDGGGETSFHSLPWAEIRGRRRRRLRRLVDFRQRG